MRMIREHRGIFSKKEIDFIQKNTSFEYIKEIEAVEVPHERQMYRVVLTDTYIREEK